LFENISLNQFYYGEGFTVLLITVLTLYLFLEFLRPLYPIKSPLLKRWMINIGLYIFNMIALYSSLHFLTESSLELQYGLFNFFEVPLFIQHRHGNEATGRVQARPTSALHQSKYLYYSTHLSVYKYVLNVTSSTATSKGPITWENFIPG